MYNLDLRKPQRIEGESTEDYILRYGQAVIESNRLHVQAIDRMIDGPKPADGPKAMPKTALEKARDNKLTIADFLAQRPDLAAKARAGKYDPFEV